MQQEVVLALLAKEAHRAINCGRLEEALGALGERRSTWPSASAPKDPSSPTPAASGWTGTASTLSPPTSPGPHVPQSLAQAAKAELLRIAVALAPAVSP